MKNVVKIFGIPMSSLGGVHLISGIDHCGKLLYLWILSEWTEQITTIVHLPRNNHKCLPD